MVYDEVNDDIEIYSIWVEQKGHPVSVHGLEQLKNLTTVWVMTFTDFDYSCLRNLKIKTLEVLSCNIDELSDLEAINGISELESLVFDGTYISDSVEKELVEKGIIFDKLPKLKSLYFSVKTYIGDDTLNIREFSGIPKFYGLPEDVNLCIHKCGIEEFSRNDIKYLKQFKNVSLTDNPVLQNPKELKKLDSAKIQHASHENNWWGR